MDKIFAAKEFRPYRHKVKELDFFCPLCGTERSFTRSPRLKLRNVAQILLITILLVALLFPIMEWKGIFVGFAVWAAFEFGIRWAFKQEIPCPHCGFDASWYHKDLNVTRQKVQQFWNAKGINTTQPMKENSRQGASSNP